MSIKAQNVGNRIDCLYVGLNFMYKFRLKSSPGPQKRGHFLNFKIFKVCSFWHQIWKEHHKISQKKEFWRCSRRWWRHSEALNIALCIPVKATVAPATGFKVNISRSKNNIGIKRREYTYTCLKDISNFQCWQVCSSDGLSVCLSVCLSGWTLLAGYRSHRLTNHH